MKIRYATEADLPAIVAIYNESVPSHCSNADTEPVSVESRRIWFARRDWARRPIWVICDDPDGSVRGWISLCDFYGRPAYSGTAEINVYVTTEAHGRGYAGRLLAFALSQCHRLGIRHLLALIFTRNQPTIHLFEKAGFRRWGLLPRIARMGDADHDLAIYGLDIPE